MALPLLPTTCSIPTPRLARRSRVVGLSFDRTVATKLNVEMILRIRALGLPFEYVVCDDLHVCNLAFHATLDYDGFQYAAE